MAFFLERNESGKDAKITKLSNAVKSLRRCYRLSCKLQEVETGKKKMGHLWLWGLRMCMLFFCHDYLDPIHYNSHHSHHSRWIYKNFIYPKKYIYIQRLVYKSSPLSNNARLSILF
jgi:hypothetical protein